MNASHGKPTRSVHFYQDTVIFQVEDTLYKVPTFRLTEGSAFFKTMFMLPQGGSDAEGTDKEGSSDENPIKLPSNVIRKDFHQFLETLYPPTLRPRERSKVEWISVLKIATLYEFHEVRAYAIEKIAGFTSLMSPLEKVKLAQEYNMADMFLQGLKELVTRAEALSEEESAQLGASISSRIGREREKCQQAGHRGNAGAGCTRVAQDVDSHVTELKMAFTRELDEIAWMNASDKEMEF